MVRQWQELFYDKRYACTCMEHAPDFVKLAEAYGAVGLAGHKTGRGRSGSAKRASNHPRPVIMDFVVEQEEVRLSHGAGRSTDHGNAAGVEPGNISEK